MVSITRFEKIKNNLNGRKEGGKGKSGRRNNDSNFKILIKFII